MSLALHITIIGRLNKRLYGIRGWIQRYRCNECIDNGARFFSLPAIERNRQQLDWHRHCVYSAVGWKNRVRTSWKFNFFAAPSSFSFSYRYCREIMTSPFWFNTIIIEIILKNSVWINNGDWENRKKMGSKRKRVELWTKRPRPKVSAVEFHVLVLKDHLQKCQWHWWHINKLGCDHGGRLWE